MPQHHTIPCAAFTVGASILDYHTGQPLIGYVGTVRVGDALFKTWIDEASGERAWECLDHQYFRL